MNPVALLTLLGAEDHTPDKALAVLYCSRCFAFHPRRCFHRDRSIARQYRYVCAMSRRDTRPSEAAPCAKCGGAKGTGKGRWHRCPALFDAVGDIR